MAQYTSNIGLHQWEPGDDFLRTDFNQDFAKIDTAVKGLESAVEGKLAKKASLEQLSQGLSTKVEMYMGSVIGAKNVTVIELGFRPRAIHWISSTNGCTTTVDGKENPAISITDTGFQVRTLQNYQIVLAGELHHYIVFK